MKSTANEIIRKWYSVPRPVTDREVIDELVNLRRKQKKGNLDDNQEQLVSELSHNGMFSCKQ